MAEYIERDKAIECIRPHVKPTTVYGDGYMQAIEHAVDILELIPAADVQPIRRGRWIEKSEDFYKQWQDSGRSWDDMPYFVTGLKFACSCCFNQYDVNAEGVEEWDFCPKCGADLRGED